ncbi:MAG: GIY-YIG nuclease family protein [Candidatus Dependentiae bacterium]|nr:GIY-YIG nuclease family protein [Candidatus Dependentiae bacterium]
MEFFYIYILRCADGSLYVGHTDDLEKRIAEHRAGCGAVYTSKRLPIALVFSERFPSRDEAFVIERKLKGWSREKKEAFIANNWEKVRALAKSGVQ